MDMLTSKTQLQYPLYACDFDAQDAGRLVVGGGGGSSRTGVGNNITLLDSSATDDGGLNTVAEIELSKDEDNVTSLAVGPRCGQLTLAFAGVNSSPADQKKGKNEHFRVFGVDSGVSTAAPKITELAHASFFATSSSSTSSSTSSKLASLPDDTYQRLVRVSAPFQDGHGGKTLPQLGACATGLARARTSQIVLFDVVSTASVESALPRVRSRIEQLPKEAADLDVIQTDADRYQLAFCNDHELYLYDVAAKDGSIEKQPVLVYTIPLDVASGATERPVFRSIRYVTPHFVLAVLNMPKRSGVRLMGLRLPSSSSSSLSTSTGETKPENTARTTTVHVAVPRSVLTQATALAVRGLSQPASPGARLGDAQFVVAVAGAPDNTIALYTLEHQAVGSIEALAKLHPFRTLRQVHEMQMTSIALSPVIMLPPQTPGATSAAAPSPPPPPSLAYIRLASVSVKNTVVVHHIPLRRLPGTAPAASGAAKATGSLPLPPPPPRYVVALKSQGPSGVSLYMFVAVIMVLIAVVSQSLLEIRGATPSVLGARQLAPASWLRPEKMTDVSSSRSPIIDNDGISVAALLRGDSGRYDGSAAIPVLFLRGEDADHTIEVVTHNEAEHGPAVAWEGLAPAQQTAWRQRLQDAGHWAEDMGETVFRGVLFSEIAGAVGEMVR